MWLVPCQHIDLWIWMWALSWNHFHCLFLRVLCIVPAQGGGRCSPIHTVKIAVHSAEGCCTATTMPPYFYKTEVEVTIMNLYTISLCSHSSRSVFFLFFIIPQVAENRRLEDFKTVKPIAWSWFTPFLLVYFGVMLSISRWRQIPFFFPFCSNKLSFDSLYMCFRMFYLPYKIN